MRPSRHDSYRGLAMTALLLSLAAPAARAADYLVTASGPLTSTFSEGKTFDGTTFGTLPPILDIDRLDGGSFRATFRFNQVTPVAGPSFFYDLDSSSGMTSFHLLDAAGAVVHHGSNPSEPQAYIQNNAGGAPFIVDQVLLTSTVNTISGSTIPTALYSPPGDLISVSDLNLAGTLGPGVDFVTDMLIPTDTATYLAFPTRIFDVFVEFADGDYINQIGPFQLVDTFAEYQIDALTVTAVPEPAVACLLFPIVTALARRRTR